MWNLRIIVHVLQMTKTFEGDNFYNLLGSLIGKTFAVLLNRNKSSFDVLKLVGKKFVVY